MLVKISSAKVLVLMKVFCWCTLRTLSLSLSLSQVLAENVLMKLEVIVEFLLHWAVYFGVLIWDFISFFSTFFVDVYFVFLLASCCRPFCSFLCFFNSRARPSLVSAEIIINTTIMSKTKMYVPYGPEYFIAIRTISI